MTRTLFRNVIFGLLCAGLVGCTALRVVTHNPSTQTSALKAGRYVLIPEHASVIFKVDHFGFSTYVGRFNDLSASLDFNPGDVGQSVLNVSIAAASIDSNIEALDVQLRAADMFDVEHHPTITFASTGIAQTGEAIGQVRGDLTMAGVTRPITLDVVLNGGARHPLTRAYTLGFSAAAELRRSDWGLAAWLPAVGNQVRLEIEVEFSLIEDVDVKEVEAGR